MLNREQNPRERIAKSWIIRLGLGACVAASIVLSSLAQDPPPPPMDDPPREALSQDDVEVLTRGPVHEAFAEPLSNEPEPGLVVTQKPPDDISEVAPDFKPEGDDVVWIPGYWAWDDDRDNFLWVSGIWRKLPPGRRWVPGYWLEAQGGWQWVAGLWVPDQEDELVYRQPPPESLEAGPSTPAPNDSYFWVPGCWMWYGTDYRWRPGYWHPYQENWVWVPAHWVWTPSGCLFVAGYWDYRVSTRGQLFAPVYFRRSGWGHTHYYSPWCAVESTPLLVHFWVRPRYSHYYFGDYYGPRYASFGISPWCQYHSSRRGRWDPLLTHYNVHYRHRDHFDYAARMSHWHSHYDHHEEDRPRRTFRDQEQFAQQLDNKPSHLREQAVLGVALAAAAKRSDRPVALKPVSQDIKQFQFKESKQFRDLTRERAKSEKFAKIDTPDRDDDRRRDRDNDRKRDDNDHPRDKDDKPSLPKTGLAPEVKTPDPSPKQKPDEPGKPLLGRDDKDRKADKDRKDGKDWDDDKRPTRGSLKLPKTTMTTGKLAADAPKAPPQINTPAPIERKDLPKVERPKPEQNIGGRPQPSGKTGSAEPKPSPRTEPSTRKPTVETPKPQPKLEAPKVQPKADPPKPQPKVEPPRVQPKVETPKPQPKVDPPKPKVEPPKVEPPRNPPKVEPPKPQPSKPPRTESPRRDDPPKRSDPPKKSDDDKKPKRGK